MSQAVFTLGLLAYVGLVWLHWGLFYADSAPGMGQRRQKAAACLGAALVPLLWLFGPFATGFYEQGWRNPLDWR
jgi:hypothetical protein